MLDIQKIHDRLGRMAGTTNKPLTKEKENKMKTNNDSLGVDFLLDVKPYDPRKAYPQTRSPLWLELEKPGPCRSLTREEIEKEYGQNA